MRLLAALCLSLSLTALAALAADIARQPFDNGNGALITVSGPFEAGDDKALARALLETHGTAVVLFESPGGSLLAGLAMGRAIRLQGATTVVDEGATCASACGLAWLGGVRRMMGAGAKVGFHAAYYVDDQGRSIETGQGNALIGAYLNQLGLSEKAVLYITQAAPADMTWLTFDDADDLGISVRQVGAAAPARPAAPPVRQAAPNPPAPPARQAAPQPAAPTAPTGNTGWQIVHHAPAGYMNIRSGPGTQHPVIFTLPPAQPVRLSTCRAADPGGGTSQWCLVSATGKQGWVSRIGLEPEGTTTVPETLAGNWQIVRDAPAGYMNVRRGPGTGHAVLFTVAPGVPVSVSRCRVGCRQRGGHLVRDRVGRAIRLDFPQRAGTRRQRPQRGQPTRRSVRLAGETGNIGRIGQCAHRARHHARGRLCPAGGHIGPEGGTLPAARPRGRAVRLVPDHLAGAVGLGVAKRHRTGRLTPP